MKELSGFCPKIGPVFAPEEAGAAPAAAAKPSVHMLREMKCCLKDPETGGGLQAGLEARLEELEPPKAGHGPNRPRKPAPGPETCRSGARARPQLPADLVPGQAGRSHTP